MTQIPMHMEGDVYAEQLRLHFEAHADDSNAPAMEQYMKNHFRFLGIKSPERRKLLSNFVKEFGFPEPGITEEMVRNLWQMPERELHYVGMELANRKGFLADKRNIHLIEWLITHKSWWDTVDYIAANVAGSWFKLYPEEIIPITTKWMASGNIWLQRTCLLFQLKYRNTTDLNLLFGFIEHLAPEKEFFIRKAIGWALRELSKTRPEAVQLFVDSHELSQLSRREALKIIKNR